MNLRYVKLWLSLAKFSLLGELAFRGNFLIKVFVELLWLGMLLLFNFTVFQQTASVLVGGIFASVAVFVVFIIVLLARPEGLAGAATARRV